MKRVLLFFVLLLIPFFVYSETCNTNDITISNISLFEKSDDVSEVNEASIIDNNINVNLRLKNVNDYIRYKLTITNNSNEKYEINKDSIINNSNYITYSLETDESNIVKPNTSKEVTLLVKYTNSVSDESYTENKYNETKTVTINLSSEEKVVNPKTGTDDTLFILVMFLIGFIIIYLIINRSEYSKFFVLLFLLIMPLGIKAICTTSINVVSNIEIDKPEVVIPSGDPTLGNYYNINTGKYYEVLNTAFSEALSNQTIQVLNDTEETIIAVLAAEKKNIKLDLNDKRIDLDRISETYVIINNGELEIINSGSETGSIEFWTGFNNTGTVTIRENVNIYSENDAMDNAGTLNIFGGVLTGSEGRGVLNQGTLNMNYGYLSGYMYGIHNEGTAILKHATVHGNNAIYNTEDGILSISDNSQLYGYGTGIANHGEFSMTNSRIDANYTSHTSIAIKNYATGFVDNSILYSESHSNGGEAYGIRNYNGQLTVNSCSIEAYGSTDGTDAYGVLNEATINITNSVIYGYSTRYHVTGGYGFDNKGTATFIGGEIKGQWYALITANGSTFTLGVNDDNIDFESPLVQGTGTSGRGVLIEPGGIFNYYDGILKGTHENNYSLYGNVVGLPEGYSINTEVVDGIEVTILHEGITH